MCDGVIVVDADDAEIGVEVAEGSARVAHVWGCIGPRVMPSVAVGAVV